MLHLPIRHRAAVLAAAAVILLGAWPAAFGAGGLPGYEVGQEARIEGLPRIVQELVAPPFLPEHDQIAQGGPKVVEVTLEVVEKEMEIAPGVFVQAMTFNGTNPGPIIVVHEGDYVELTLRNPASNTMPHNIDFHASTGTMVGGSLTLVGPGQQVKLRWKATQAGTFIYYYAPGGTMIPYHVVAGMNGAVMAARDGPSRDDPEGDLANELSHRVIALWLQASGRLPLLMCVPFEITTFWSQSSHEGALPRPGEPLSKLLVSE